MKESKTLKEKIEWGEASDEEIDQFRSYVEEVAFEEMERAALEPQERDRSGEWADVLLQIQEKERAASKTYYLYLPGKVAAVVCVALLAWTFYDTEWKDTYLVFDEAFFLLCLGKDDGMQKFELAIRRQLAASERAYFFIVQEKSSNVVNDLTVRDTDGAIYEVKGSEDAEKHREMLVRRGWVLGYVPREEYVSYRLLEEGEVREEPFELVAPVE